MAKLANGTNVRFIVSDFKKIYEGCLAAKGKAAGYRIFLDNKGFVTTEEAAVGSCDLTQEGVEEFIAEYKRLLAAEGGNQVLMATKLIRFILQRLS